MTPRAHTALFNHIAADMHDHQCSLHLRYATPRSYRWPHYQSERLHSKGRPKDFAFHSQEWQVEESGTLPVPCLSNKTTISQLSLLAI